MAKNKTHLIIVDRDILWEYYFYYRKNKPRARTFPFAKTITYKLFNKDGTPKMTASGKSQAQKTRPLKFTEIEKNDMIYKVLSLNDLLPCDRMNYKNKKEKWGDLGKWIAMRYKVHGLEIENAMVEFVFYPETKAKSDNDNSIGASKILNDGLFVQSGMFIDDNHYHINPLLVSTKYDKDHPRMEIRITEFDNAEMDAYEKIKIHIKEWE